MTAAEFDAYSGPEYWVVRPVDDHQFELTDRHGTRVATYPTARLAHKVRIDKDAQAMRAYLRAQRRVAK